VTGAGNWQPAGVVVDLKRAQVIGPASLAGPWLGLSPMAISPDGTTLLVGDADGPVRVQRVADGQVLHTIPGQSPVTVVAWSPKGQRLAIGRGDGTSEVYSLDPLQRVVINSGSDQVSVLGFVGENGLMRESSTGSIARYDLAALSPVATQVPSAPIHALDAAGGLIAQGEDNGRVTIRDGATLKQIGKKLTLGPYRSRDRGPQMALRRQVTALALTPDGSAVIAADRVGHLRMWSLPERELLWSRDDAPTTSLAISPDGRYLATIGSTANGVAFGIPATSTYTVWDLSTHTVHLSADLMQLRANLKNRRYERYDTTPTSVVFSPDGSRVAIAFSDGLVLIHDVALRDRTWLETHETAPSIVFTPDGQRLMAANGTYLQQADATTGQGLSRSLLPGPREVTRMTYTEDGQWLVISHPRSLTVLDAQTLQVAVADLALPTEAPTDTIGDAFAVAAGQNHQLLVGTGSVLASITMDPEQWKSAACQIAAPKLTTHELTNEEWNHFLPGIPYSPACQTAGLARPVVSHPE
jgi:WD40 repeat protein